MNKIKEIWKRFQNWLNGGPVKKIGYETNEQTIEQFTNEEIAKIMAALDNPIMDPAEKKALETQLRKELKLALEKHIDPEKKPAEEIKAEQQENQVEDNGTKTIEQAEEETRKIDPKHIGYMDRLTILHDMKMRLYKEQGQNQRGVTDLKYTETVMRYEKMLLDEREGYVASLSDEEKKKFKEEETKLKLQELKTQKRAEEKYTERYNQFSRIVGDIERIREEKDAAMTRFRKGEIDQEECNRLKKIADEDLEVALLAMTELKPEELLEDVKTIEQRDTMQEKILGGDYRTKQIANATAELASKIEDSHERDKKGVAEITSVEEYFQNRGVHGMTEDLEKHLEELKNELDEVKADLDKGNISSEKLSRAKDLLKEVETTQEEVIQYSGMDESATSRDDSLGDTAHEGIGNIEATSETVDEKYGEVEETIKEVEKNEGKQIVEDPDQAEIINEGIKEVVDPMGLSDLVNAEPDEEAIKNKQERDKMQAAEELEEMENGKVRRLN